MSRGRSHKERSAVLRFVSTYISEHGQAPTWKEVRIGTALRQPKVNAIIRELQKAEVLEFDEGVARSLRIAPKGVALLSETKS
jgi:hypothetical protein